MARARLSPWQPRPVGVSRVAVAVVDTRAVALIVTHSTTVRLSRGTLNTVVEQVLSFLVLFLAYATTFLTIEDSCAAVHEKEQNYTAFKSPEFRKYFFRRHLVLKLIQFSRCYLWLPVCYCLQRDWDWNNNLSPKTKKKPFYVSFFPLVFGNPG